MNLNSTPVVAFVHRSARHEFSKLQQSQILLIEDVGVENDAHAGVTVKHRSRVARDPTQPNLRQVHLIHHELIDDLNARGFDVAPGAMGENITTRGIDLLSLPRGTKLKIGPAAVIAITGLRNPCKQLDNYQAGLMNAVLDRDETGALIRKAGVMAIVLTGGVVQPNDTIGIDLPTAPFQRLEPV